MARRNRSLSQRIAIAVAVIVGRRVVRRQVKRIIDDLLTVEPVPQARSTAKKVGVGVAAVAVAATAAAAAAVWFGRSRGEPDE